jgi:hypothetical protein
MIVNMASASAQLNSCPDNKDKEGLGEEEESFNKNDLSIHSGDHNLSIEECGPNAVELSLGIFNAEHSKKVRDSKQFLAGFVECGRPISGKYDYPT